MIVFHLVKSSSTVRWHSNAGKPCIVGCGLYPTVQYADLHALNSSAPPASSQSVQRHWLTLFCLMWVITADSHSTKWYFKHILMRTTALIYVYNALYIRHIGRMCSAKHLGWLKYYQQPTAHWATRKWGWRGSVKCLVVRFSWVLSANRFFLHQYFEEPVLNVSVLPMNRLNQLTKWLNGARSPHFIFGKVIRLMLICEPLLPLTWQLHDFPYSLLPSCQHVGILSSVSSFL